MQQKCHLPSGTQHKGHLSASLHQHGHILFGRVSPRAQRLRHPHAAARAKSSDAAVSSFDEKAPVHRCNEEKDGLKQPHPSHRKQAGGSSLSQQHHLWFTPEEEAASSPSIRHHLWHTGSGSSRMSSASSGMAVARGSPAALDVQDVPHDPVSWDESLKNLQDHTVWDSYGSRDSTPSGRVPSERSA